MNTNKTILGVLLIFLLIGSVSLTAASEARIGRNITIDGIFFGANAILSDFIGGGNSTLCIDNSSIISRCNRLATSGYNIIDGAGTFYETELSVLLNRYSGFSFYNSGATIYTIDDNVVVKFRTGGSSADINAYMKDGSSESHIYVDKDGTIEILSSSNEPLLSSIITKPAEIDVTTSTLNINGNTGLTGCYTVNNGSLVDQFCYTNGILTGYTPDY